MFFRPLISFERSAYNYVHHTHHAAAHRQGPGYGQGDQRHSGLCGNPQKTDNGRLITGYECDSRIADAEFLFPKKRYAERGRCNCLPPPPVLSFRRGHAGGDQPHGSCLTNALLDCSKTEIWNNSTFNLPTRPIPLKAQVLKLLKRP